MKNLALKRIQAMKPYRPPIDGRSMYPGLLLDFNERSTAPAASVRQALLRRDADVKPQLYPEYFDLDDKLAAYAGVQNSQVMITNGTDQAIDIIFRTFTDRDDTIIIPEPTFAMYAQYARVNGNRIASPLYGKDDLAYPLQAVLDGIDDSVKLIVVCNPNNPTGTLLPAADIGKIARQAPNAIVYVDEAYFEFSGVTAAGLVDKYPNVIISRTFSKAFGLAGLRIGYVIAQQQYITEMLKVRGPYDVNQLAYRAAVAALANTEDVKSYCREVMEQAKPLVEKFFRQNNVNFYPSAGNFILFKPANPAAVAETLRREGIAVRPQAKPNIKGTLRLTVGTTAQMKTFIGVYKEAVLKQAPQKYAFIDRDGTLIYEPPDSLQIDSLEKLRILDGVIEGLQRLRGRGYRLVMVSNQDGVGTASFPLASFEGPQQAMLDTFRDAGITFERVFICPHLPEDNCNCRKPKTGLLDDWLKATVLDTKQSFVYGDRASDKGLAGSLGLTFVQMTTNGNFLTAINKEILR
jgi:histidinol-phosphate aminotransferase